MVKVKALKRVYYGGKEYSKDDELDVSERDAAVFGALRKVMRGEAEAKKPEAKPETAKTETAKTEPKPAQARAGGTYSRRDQRAED